MYDLYVYRHEKFWARRNSFILFLLVNVNKHKYIVCVACNKKYDLNSKFRKVGSNVGHNIFDFCVYNIIHEVIFILLLFFQNFALIELTLPCYEPFLRYNFIFSRIVRFPHIFEKRYVKQLKDTIKNIIIWWFVRNVVS